MITDYKNISDAEIVSCFQCKKTWVINFFIKGILQRQFESSYFYDQQLDTKPTKLAIFDFDSTLFFSPLLSPTIWHKSFIHLATAEGVYGPGWWRDIRSLDLGPFEELKKTAWEGFWNEKIVKKARECIEDPNTMTVVLTGRRYHPFHLLVPDMLEAKQLQFDLIGLRPDPEHVSDNHWKVRNGLDSLTYNLASSIFSSTMHFKTCFILNILHNVPSIKNVVMWDDRLPHVKRFREYLSALKNRRLISQDSVVYVPGIRPPYNPGWEKNVIRHIIETHNKAVLKHAKDGVEMGKSEQRISWPVVETEDPLSDSPDSPLKLVKLPAATIVKLSKEDTDRLQTQYKSVFAEQLENLEVEDLGGERAVYFGTSVYISQNVERGKSTNVGPIGTEVSVTVKAYSKVPTLSCLLLQVQVESGQYILPLWFKPSEYHDIFKLNVEWIPVKEESVLKGKVDYEYRLGVEEKQRRTKKRDRQSDYGSVQRTKRTKT
jgi:hypothetical protein